MAEKTRTRVYVGAGLAVAFVAILAGFLWFPVCDDQVTDGGDVVHVCRHVATDPPVVVLGVLVLVLLSSRYAEISGFGITLKSRVAQLEQRSASTERKAADLQVTVGDLTDFNREQVVPQMLGPQLRAASPERVPDPRIVDLADRYNTLRWTMPSGHERTRQMTHVADQLREALRDAPDFDVVGHLRHEDRGVRLAAFAYLENHARPDLLTAEDKPFGQYSALRAALHQVTTGARLTGADRRTLRALRDRVHKSDRCCQLIKELLGES